MRNIAIPIYKVGKIRVFELFPVILAIIITWVYGVIVTEGTNAAIQKRLLIMEMTFSNSQRECWINYA